MELEVPEKKEVIILTSDEDEEEKDAGGLTDATETTEPLIATDGEIDEAMQKVTKKMDQVSVRLSRTLERGTSSTSRVRSTNKPKSPKSNKSTPKRRKSFHK